MSVEVRHVTVVPPEGAVGKRSCEHLQATTVMQGSRRPVKSR